MRFLLSKVVGSLLVPPGLWVVFALLVGAVSLRRGSRRGAVAAWVFAGLLYLGNTHLVEHLLLAPLERAFPVWDAGGGVRYVVVLGGGAQAGTPAGDVPGVVSLARLWGGLRYARMLGVPLVLAGGSVWDEGKSEGEMMADLVRELGWEEVVVEGESRTTWENARNTARMVGRGPVLLVTSAYHMQRAVWCFRAQGVEVIPAPVDFRDERPAHWIFYLGISAEAARDVQAALREYVGMVWYRVAYGSGLP